MEENADILLIELNEISPLVAGISKSNVFLVPEGYFNSLANCVLTTVTQEVPEGYFDDLANTILRKIDGTATHELSQISPMMAGLKKLTPYQVPHNYFEQLSATINIDNTTSETPEVLQNLHKSNPYQIPLGYFNQLSVTILNKINQSTGAKIITMPKRSIGKWKYAIAAIFTGIIVLGIYQYSQINITETIWSENEFNAKVDKIAEEDIIRYLERNGADADMAALSSGVLPANLPDEEAYFIDDNTLDSFLEEIELKN